MIETTGKVASEVVQSLKGNPLAFSLIVINVLFLAVTLFVLISVKDSSERRDKLIHDLITNCRVTAK